MEGKTEIAIEGKINMEQNTPWTRVRGLGLLLVYCRPSKRPKYVLYFGLKHKFRQSEINILFTFANC